MKSDATFAFYRNPSYWDSLRLGLRHGLFLLPESFMLSMRHPVLAVLIAIFLVVFTIVTWTASKIFILFAGLVGFLNVVVTDSVNQD